MLERCIRAATGCPRWVQVLTLALLLASGQPPWTVVGAGEADVLDVEVQRTPDGYRFDVTVRHADTGWEHYADRFEIRTEAGELLGTRVLHHPHVDEQPFRRALTGVTVPAGVTSVIVRAHDNVHGFGGKAVRVELPEGP